MSLLNPPNFQDQEEQKRLRKELCTCISGPEKDDTDSYLSVGEEPIPFRRTVKLGAISCPAANENSIYSCLEDVAGQNGPNTPPILPLFNINHAETAQMPAITRLSDFTNGEHNVRQSLYDADITQAKGLQIITLAFIQHQRIYGRTPSFVFLSNELLHEVCLDLQIIYQRSIQKELTFIQIPFINEQAQLVQISVALDPSLPKYRIRFRELPF